MRSLFSTPVFTPDDIVAGAASSAVVIPTATKPQPGLYWVLKSDIEKIIEDGKEVEKVKGGAFDFYIVDGNGGIFIIKQPSGEKEEATNKEEIEKALSQYQDVTYSEDKTKKFTTKQIFSGESTEEYKIIKEVHNCYLGHGGQTCGWTTLASDIALLANKLDSKNVKIDKNSLTIEIPGFEGKIELKTGSDNDFENRKALATWLETNKELLEKLSPALKTEGGQENFFKEIQRISQLKDITGISDCLTQQIFGVVDALKDLTPEKIAEAKLQINFDKKIREIEKKSKEENQPSKKELQNQYEEKKELLAQSGMKINWENITIEDVAILALLSAFLAVISGPSALAIPVAIAAFRAISIEKGLNLEGKVDFPKPNPSPDPKEATQVVKESQKQSAGGATAGAGVGAA